MDIQKEWDLFVAHLRTLGVVKIGRNALGVITNLTREGNCSLGYNNIELMWEIWQVRAQAIPEGFVLVPEEPYAYLIKHKLWNKNSQPEIYLADDFVGNDGVEKEKLIVCIPLYKGEDEAQEQSHEHS